MPFFNIDRKNLSLRIRLKWLRIKQIVTILHRCYNLWKRTLQQCQPIRFKLRGCTRFRNSEYFIERRNSADQENRIISKNILSKIIGFHIKFQKAGTKFSDTKFMSFKLFNFDMNYGTRKNIYFSYKYSKDLFLML